MGMVQLPDELQRLIDRQVAQGRASSSADFLQKAVMRLVDEAGAEEDAIQQSVLAGLTDIEAGRYRTIATPQDERLLQDHLVDRLRARLALDG